MILVRQVDAQSKLLANDKGAAYWHVWKQESPGDYSVPTSTISRNIVPTKSYIQRDGAIHGYKPEPGSGRPQRSKSADIPIQDADRPTNMLVLASMSPSPPRQLEDHKIPAPPPAVGGMYVRSEDGKLVESSHYKEWMAAQRAPSELELKHHKQNFTELLFLEAEQCAASGIVSKLSQQRSPRSTLHGAARPVALEPDAPGSSASPIKPSIQPSMGRKHNPDLWALTSDGKGGYPSYDHDSPGTWGGGHADAPAIRARGIGSSDILNPTAIQHAGGSVQRNFEDWGAAAVDTSFPRDRHVPLQDSVANAALVGRGKSDVDVYCQYSISPRQQRAEYKALELQAREKADHNTNRRQRTSVTVADWDERERARRVTYASAALASSDLNAELATREYWMSQPTSNRFPVARGQYNLPNFNLKMF